MKQIQQFSVEAHFPALETKREAHFSIETRFYVGGTPLHSDNTDKPQQLNLEARFSASGIERERKREKERERERERERHTSV
jgi:hypothetical protein